MWKLHTQSRLRPGPLMLSVEHQQQQHRQQQQQNDKAHCTGIKQQLFQTSHIALR